MAVLSVQQRRLVVKIAVTYVRVPMAAADMMTVTMVTIARLMVTPTTTRIKGILVETLMTLTSRMIWITLKKITRMLSYFLPS